MTGDCGGHLGALSASLVYRRLLAISFPGPGKVPSELVQGVRHSSPKWAGQSL